MASGRESGQAWSQEDRDSLGAGAKIRPRVRLECSSQPGEGEVGGRGQGEMLGFWLSKPVYWVLFVQRETVSKLQVSRLERRRAEKILRGSNYNSNINSYLPLRTHRAEHRTVLYPHLPVLTVKSAPATAEKTEAQRNTVTTQVSHRVTPIHRMVQKRVQRPRSLLYDLVPLATCSDLRFCVCTKKDLVTGLCCRIQEAQGSKYAQTMGFPTDTGHHTCSSPNHAEKKT